MSIFPSESSTRSSGHSPTSPQWQRPGLFLSQSPLGTWLKVSFSSSR